MSLRITYCLVEQHLSQFNHIPGKNQTLNTIQQYLEYHDNSTEI